MKLPAFTRSPYLIQILAIASACFSAIGSGMQYAWTSPFIPKLINDESINISIEQASYSLVIQGFAMALSAPFASIALDKIGRKITVLLVVVPQIIGWILEMFIINIWMLYIARTVVGIAESAFYATVHIYVCEISDPYVRHGWANMVSIAPYLGIFLVNVIGSSMSIRSAALLCMCIPFLHLIVFSWVPESPYYLLMKNRTAEARKALQILRSKVDVNDELDTLTHDVNRQLSEVGTWRNLFYIPSNSRAFLIVAGVRVLQQLSGITAFEVYTQYMFQAANVDLSAPESAIIFSGMLSLGAILSVFVLYRFGRKPLLMYSSLGCGFSLALEAIYFAIKTFTNVNAQQLYWFPLFGMMLYVIFFSLGLAALPSLIVGEMFSASIKSKATIANNVVTASCLLVIPKVFQLLTDNCGIFSSFCLFSVCCFVGLVFIHYYIVETKGKTLEEIQQELTDNSRTQKQTSS